MLFDRPIGPRERVAQALWALGWLGVVAVGLWLHPEAQGHGTHEQLGLPPCPSVLLFNRPCPACGLTTSWTALMHGDLSASLAAHPLGPLLFASYTAWAWLAAWGAIKGLRLDTNANWFSRPVVAIGAIFLGFGIFRAWTSPPFQSPVESVIARVIVPGNRD